VIETLPPGLVPYRRTPEFSETTVPAALRRRHSTKAGVWARICVVRGSLRYRILEAHAVEASVAEEHVLLPGRPGVVEPEVPHEVEPLGEVRFYVEFLRRSR
jgi:tellurite resistance-related uncharacterized protein